jgi:hypothetical protein
MIEIGPNLAWALVGCALFLGLAIAAWANKE